MATSLDNNRKNLYNIIKNEFVSSTTNKILSYDEWFNLFFESINTLTDQPSTGDGKGNTKYNNLFLIINFKKVLGSKETIIDYYFKPNATGYADWMKVLKTKKEFYKAFACDLPWAQSINFCKGDSGNDVPVTDEVTLKLLMGNYVSDNPEDGEFKVFELPSNNPNEPLKLGISSYNFEYLTGVLENPIKKNSKIILTLSFDTSSITSISSFSKLFPNVDLSGLKPQIIFNEDGKSFTYDILNHKGTATKTEEQNIEDKKTDTKKTDDNKKSSEKKPYKPHQTTLYNKETDYDKIEDDDLIVKSCDDFPFGLGCKNKLIGDLNEKLFGSRRNETYSKLLENYLTSLTLFSQDNLDKLITKNVWDKAMTMGTIKESVRKVLKEYINGKK
jgi:hypothetical protein